MKRLFSACLLCCFVVLAHFSSPVEAAQWHTFLGGGGYDEASKVVEDGEGNSYVFGTAGSSWGSPLNAYSGGSDAFLLKLDSSGSIVWLTFLGSSGTDVGARMVMDSSGNLILQGASSQTWGNPVNAHSGSNDVFVAKVDKDGRLLWNTFSGGAASDSAQGVALSNTGHIYTVQRSDGNWGTAPVRAYSGGPDIAVVKYNSNGTRAWNTFLGSTNVDEGNEISILPDGYIVVGGYSRATWGAPLSAHNGGDDVVLAKLNTNGVLEWSNFFGGTGNDNVNDIHVDDDGFIYFSGYSFSTWGSPVYAYSGGQEGVVAKVSADGSLVWNTFQGSSQADVTSQLGFLDNGFFYALVSSESSWGNPQEAHHGGLDMTLALFNSSGALIWNSFFGASGSDYGYGLSVSEDNVFICGKTNASWGVPVRAFSGGAWDGFVIKLPATGFLPDTGQSKCYDDTGVISCPSFGEDYYGQDAHYKSSRSFTNNGDGTVTDDVTGLIWQQADDGTTRNWADAVSYCEDLTLAGESDWRLPEKQELVRIVDTQRSSPSIDPIFTARSEHYWSKSQFVADPSNRAWGVHFGQGDTDEHAKTMTIDYVRCVRGGLQP